MESETLAVRRTPIARLPVEILLNVVNLIAEDPSYEDHHTYLPDLSIAMSHVCRFWRDVVLGRGAKALWTYVPLRHSPDCVRTFMARSHPLPVSMDVVLSHTSKKSTSLPALVEAVNYMDRVERLSYLSHYWDDDKFEHAEQHIHQIFYEVLSAQSAPILKRMLWNQKHTWLSPYEPSSLVTTPPAMMFADQVLVTPSLSSLTIHGTVVSSAHLSLRANITFLKLEECLVWNTTDDLIDTLSCLSCLESLLLKQEWHRILYDTTVDTERSAELPHLKTLSVICEQLDIPSAIVAHVRMPIKTRIHIEGDYGWEFFEEDLSILCDALEDHYSANSLSSDREFAFSAVSIGQGGCYGGITVQALHGGMTYLSLALDNYLAPRVSCDNDVALALESLLDVSIMSHTTRLHVSHSAFFGIGRAADWISLHSRMPNLDTIVLSRMALHGLCSALLAPPDLESGIIFPFLSCLRLEGIIFEDDGPAATFFLVALLRISQSRIAHGHPLKRIEISRYSDRLWEVLTSILPGVHVVRHKLSSQDDSLGLQAIEASRWDDGAADLRG